MCTANQISEGVVTKIPRPRWGRLYGIALAGLAVLTLGNVAIPDVARSPLDGLVAGAVLVAFAWWTRGNRAALDQQAWCECAGETLTVRVVPSRRPEPIGSTRPWVPDALLVEDDEDAREPVLTS
jgi:hypothetical protein